MNASFYKTSIGGLLLAGCLATPSCEKDRPPVALESFQFTLSASADTLNVGETQQAAVTPSPENATERIVWASADPEIAQVQSNEPGWVAGVIGLKVGSTRISASTADGRYSQSFPLTVIVKVDKITLSNEMILSSPGEGRFGVIFDPENATIQEVMWNSGDGAVAEVDPATGAVTARSPGSSVITATTRQGGKTAAIEVFVSGTPPAFGKAYCSITGYGDYNANVVATQGAAQDLSHSNANIPPDSYGYYEGEKLAIERGASFTLSLVQSNTWSRSLVWIDYNGDKDFADEGELVAVWGNLYNDDSPAGSKNEEQFSKVATVPQAATPGYSRMRVITGDAWSLDFDSESAEPCGNVKHGTVKDFEVEIR